MRHRNYAIEPIINSLETPRTSSRISAMRRVYDGITRSTTLSGTAESPWRGFSSPTEDNGGEMITDATTTADFLFGFLLVHRNLGLSSKEHQDEDGLFLSLHVGCSFASTQHRRRFHVPCDCNEPSQQHAMSNFLERLVMNISAMGRIWDPNLRNCWMTTPTRIFQR